MLYFLKQSAYRDIGCSLIHLSAGDLETCLLHVYLHPVLLRFVITDKGNPVML